MFIAVVLLHQWGTQLVPHGGGASLPTAYRNTPTALGLVVGCEGYNISMVLVVWCGLEAKVVSFWKIQDLVIYDMFRKIQYINKYG